MHPDQIFCYRPKNPARHTVGILTESNSVIPYPIGAKCATELHAS